MHAANRPTLSFTSEEEGGCDSILQRDENGAQRHPALPLEVVYQPSSATKEMGGMVQMLVILIEIDSILQ